MMGFAVGDDEGGMWTGVGSEAVGGDPTGGSTKIIRESMLQVCWLTFALNGWF